MMTFNKSSQFPVFHLLEQGKSYPTLYKLQYEVQV